MPQNDGPNRGSGLSRRTFLQDSTAVFALALAAEEAPAQSLRPVATRERWLGWMQRVSDPVMSALSRRELRRAMPVEAVEHHEAERAVGTPLEALGRLLMGLAPWLELDPAQLGDAAERTLQARYRSAAREAIASAVDPASPDYMRFGESSQTVVDASFLALAMLRAPKQLIDTLSAATREHMVAAMHAERKVLTGLNNWVLFAAMDEALLFRLGADWDRMRVAYALNELQAWYVGDGTYGDGPRYHADFYNSYVMQSYLLMLMDVLGDQSPAWSAMRIGIQRRASRYAAIQERLISPEGTFPVLGRSICYRAGAFHLLADAAFRGMLPQHVSGAQVRCALTAAQIRTLDAAATFDKAGWLQIGLAGHQPGLAETYISTGSLYLCSAAWLPMGLPPAHPFWAAPDEEWTQKAVWSGGKGALDHALAD